MRSTGFSDNVLFMKCLSIDTVTESCSVALLDGCESIQHKEIRAGGHGRSVLNMVSRVMADGGLGLRQLDAVVVDAGPGSFTGVRIGLGVAQGLAYGANLPVIGVSSLEVMAISVERGIVASAIDARMKQIYGAIYEVRASGRPAPILAPRVCFPAEFGAELGSAQYAVGNGWDIYADMVASDMENRPIRVGQICFPEALQGLTMAQRIGIEGATDPGQLEATYIRDQVTG